MHLTSEQVWGGFLSWTRFVFGKTSSNNKSTLDTLFKDPLVLTPRLKT